MAAWFVAGPLTLVTLATLAIVYAASLTPVPVSAGACPASIDETITVAEVGGGPELAPSEFDRAFPEVPGLLAPGASGGDALSIRSIAEVPVLVTLIVEPEESPVRNDAHDLQVTITWAGTVAATGSYSQIVGQRVPLGTIAPQERGTLQVDVDLPAVTEKDNDTQERTWPLRFDLGVRADSGCDSDRTDDRADADTGGSRDGSGTAEDGAGADGSAADGSSSDGDGKDGGTTATDAGAHASGNGSALPRTGVDGLGIIALAAFVLAFAGFLLIVGGRGRSQSAANTADEQAIDEGK